VKWVVTFAGGRDQYQVPLALAEAGMLETLVTDWYSPLDQWPWRYLQRAVPRADQYLRRRYREGLPSALVKRNLAAIMKLKLQGSQSSDRALGDTAAQVARNRHTGLLAYSFYGHAAFRRFNGERRPKVLYQIQAHPHSFERIVSAQSRTIPEVCSWVGDEPEFKTPARLSELAREHRMADYCIAPSKYVKDTLVQDGADPERISVLPYGVDCGLFAPSERPSQQCFRVTFVGRICFRKGLWHLLEAWRRLSLPNAELVIAGAGDAPFMRQFADICTRVQYVRSQVALRDLLSSSHICCVPSLSDSFGLIYLQALACGTPIIATHNSGAPDLITNFQEGFVISSGDIDALCDRLLWCYRNQSCLNEMRPRARTLATKYSWPMFRQRLASMMQGIELQKGASAT
jgi:glycosyltransferase involved in cell wall biosynthesis